LALIKSFINNHCYKEAMLDKMITDCGITAE